MRNGALITYRAESCKRAVLVWGCLAGWGRGDPGSAQLSSSLCLCGFINYTHVGLMGLNDCLKRILPYEVVVSATERLAYFLSFFLFHWEEEKNGGGKLFCEDHGSWQSL